MVHCVASVMLFGGAIGHFIWHFIFCVALLFIALSALYLAYGWFAGIFTG
jgi:hypothetical protein